MTPDMEEKMEAWVQAALREDIGSGDHTTISIIPPSVKGKAVLKIKEDGVLAGVKIAEYIFQYVQPDCKFFVRKQDGDTMHPGEVAFEVETYASVILQCERLVLNTLQRMSGIATLTRSYVEKLKNYRTKILDTRKTTPNFRLLEKEAVRIGGGMNHRFGLYDMILIKDNHIDYCGGLKEALNRAKIYVQQNYPNLKIEVEARSLQDVDIILSDGAADRILLDNFSIEDLRKAVDRINGQMKTEASGGINLGNLEAYASTGVDYISSGALIHQARSLDMSLKAVLNKK
jgi:nicotinate-nucleotide pyrophosphorylase (carboxylating)